jgi:glyoxylase-like metal-dependent hydrolase (beta-lactamase superfamily II)
VGDLMMGGQATSLVAPPEGDLAAYLASLARIRQLEPDVLYPAHGPPFDEPATAIDAYIRHRAEREARILEAASGEARDEEQLLDAVYGDALDPALRDAARAALRAYLVHLEARGEITRQRDGRIMAV